MTQARKSQICTADTCFYHLISRCVRRAFLCGEDKYSGKSFEHRRQWMVDRIRFLTSVFAIDLAAYAVLSNHYHIVVYVNENEANSWTNEEVCKRWLQLYSGHVLVTHWQQGKTTSEAEVQAALEIIEKWRNRLSDISWLMRALNEYIARKANKEDECKGRFWEGRFKSQALLDDKAVLACMAYVDLNPIRAGMANSLQTSQYTSIFERANDKASEHDHPENLSFKIKPLLGFIGYEHQEQPHGICYSLIDYFNLLEETGRIIRADKSGHIDASQFTLLAQRGFTDKNWMYVAEHFGKEFHQAVGSLSKLAMFAEHTNKHWISGQRQQAARFR